MTICADGCWAYLAQIVTLVSSSIIYLTGPGINARNPPQVKIFQAAVSRKGTEGPRDGAPVSFSGRVVHVIKSCCLVKPVIPASCFTNGSGKLVLCQLGGLSLVKVSRTEDWTGSSKSYGLLRVSMKSVKKNPIPRKKSHFILADGCCRNVSYVILTILSPIFCSWLQDLMIHVIIYSLASLNIR